MTDAADPDLTREAASQDVAAMLPAFYSDLRQIAGAYMRQERADHTLQPTALVNEAFLRMAGTDKLGWKTRTQFLSVAAQMMRRILVDHARRRGATKRGGDARRMGFDEAASALALPDVNLLDLDDALGALSAVSERAGRVVELRFFGGLTQEESAEVLGVSRRTVEDDWYVARAWLRQQLA